MITAVDTLEVVLRVLPKALVNELLLGRHGAAVHCCGRRASRHFSGGSQPGNSLCWRQRGEPAPKRPPSPPPSMPTTTTNSAGYPPDIRISGKSGYPPDPAHDPPDQANPVCTVLYCDVLCISV